MLTEERSIQQSSQKEAPAAVSTGKRSWKLDPSHRGSKRKGETLLTPSLGSPCLGRKYKPVVMHPGQVPEKEIPETLHLQISSIIKEGLFYSQLCIHRRGVCSRVYRCL